MTRGIRDGRGTDLTFTWLPATYGTDCEQWRKFATEWMAEQNDGIRAKRLALTGFFETYLMKYAPYAVNVEDFFSGTNGHLCSADEFKKALKESGVKVQKLLNGKVNKISDFLEWVILNYYSKKDDRGQLQPLVHSPIKNLGRTITSPELRRADLEFSWLVTDHGKKWEQWRKLVAEWITLSDKSTDRKRLALSHFFESYLMKYAPYAANMEDFFHGKKGHLCSVEEMSRAFKETGIKDPGNRYERIVCEFFEWVIPNYYSRKDDLGYLLPLVKNPFSELRKSDGRSTNLGFVWLLTTHGLEWEQWRKLAAEWMAWLKSQQGAWEKQRVSLVCFFERYILKYAPYAISVEDFFHGKDGHLCSTDELINALKESGVVNPKVMNERVNCVCDFLDWTIKKYYSQKNEFGYLEPFVNSPITGVSRKDGRGTDLKFTWMLTTLGPEWAQWAAFAAEWMAGQHEAVSSKLGALSSFFDCYLSKYAPYTTDVREFFRGKAGHRCSTDEYVKALQNSGVKDSGVKAKRVGHITDFLDFIIGNHFSFEDDKGFMRPVSSNPFFKITAKTKTTESVSNPLPYRYIQKLRNILCPPPSWREMDKIRQSLQPGKSLLQPWHYRHFKDWTWAQNQSGQYKYGKTGAWFQVDPDLIDKSDPDCVWRVLHRKGIKGKSYTIHQIWSPVAAMVLFVKLHLPLRTYQTRFLDSGEADTWRYEHGEWVENTVHSFALGKTKRPYARGVFTRIYDSMEEHYSTGLFVSTNKTADMNKDEVDRGYIIPWQHNELLYWLEKLRNWQEKYNPIHALTPCVDLKKQHFGQVKSQKVKEQMGDICFLFRDASAPYKGNNRDKPIKDHVVTKLWYQTLLELQNKLKREETTLSDGSTFQLVIDDSPRSNNMATMFPLHSMRVSLITAYVMETELPLPVVSKLLAGHSRMLMTIYYNKITPSMMAEKMQEAEQEMDAKGDQSLRTFLANASLEQIQYKVAYNNRDSIAAVLANRNPIAWEYRHHGLCLVGGNQVKTEKVHTIGGCWNGGEVISESKAARSRTYDPVPNGPENCVRCRWFVTDASHLPALTAHFNLTSYLAHQAANRAVKIEGDLEAIKDDAFIAEQEGQPFTRQHELQALQRRYEKQLVLADEYTKDLIATFNLIKRIISLEETRLDEDGRDKLVAVGSAEHVQPALKFLETESELFHHCLICDDAEVFPDLQDELCKTPAIAKRTIELSRIMMRKGYSPVFMEMTEEMQLCAANAVIRRMATLADPNDRFEGYRKVAGYLEAEDYLRDQKLLDEGVAALKVSMVEPISVTKRTSPGLENA